MRKATAGLKPYLVVQDTSVVKLNQNESPYDVPARLKNSVLDRLAKENWNRYPCHPPQQLIEDISRYTGHPQDGIVVGNSSNEIVMSALQAICAPRNRMIVVSPGFPMYPRVGQILGLKIIEVPLKKDFEFDIRAIKAAARNAELVILASPNNPTGTALSVEQIGDLARQAEGIVVIDEAYYEFHQRTALGLLKRFKNLVIIRTLSKAFRLAGARIGYLLAGPEIAQAVEVTKLPFSVGIFQQAVGSLIIRNGKFQRRLILQTVQQRNFVYAELKKIPLIHPIPSLANFILFKIKNRPALEVFNALYQRGVLLRPLDHPNLKNTLRVTIGTPRENTTFLKALKQVMQGT